VQAARRFLASQLELWRREEVLWSALQAVSELATNCVLHARTAFTVTARLLADGALRLEVADGADGVPRQRHYGDDATTGRGVALVAGLARTWGVDRRLEGKIVWCEIDDEPIGGAILSDDEPAALDLESFLGANDHADGRRGSQPSVAAAPLAIALRRIASSAMRRAA